MKLAIALVGALIVFGLTPADLSFAQGAAPNRQVIELRPGFTRLLEFDQSVKTVAIGNPDVADATVQSDRAALLTAKQVGETNVIAINPQGQEIFRALVLVGGGNFGRTVVYARGNLHEYWTYRCTDSGCQRVQDKFEFQEAPSPIIVAPQAQSGTNGQK